MPKSGWKFIASALKKDGRYFTHACVRVDHEFGQIDVTDLQAWLEKMTFFDDFDDPEWYDNPYPTPNGRIFDFALWDSEGHLWYPTVYDGIAQLARKPATPEAWLREYRTSPDEPDLVEIER